MLQQILKNGLESATGLQTAMDYKVIQYIVQVKVLDPKMEVVNCKIKLTSNNF